MTTRRSRDFYPAVMAVLCACAGADRPTISGAVTFHGQALAGVTLIVDGSGTAVTDAQGRWAQTVSKGTSHTVTPARAGFTFEPAHAVSVASGGTANFVATETASLSPLRGMSIGGNWGGNIDGIKSVPDEFVAQLVTDNVGWVGIKQPIFIVSSTDPTVQVVTRPPGDTNYANMYSFDDADLAAAIADFKAHGLHVYLSLVPIQPSGDPSTTCGTARYVPDPHVWGDPAVPSATNSSAWGYGCIDASTWWWSPTHPQHAGNVAAFWSSYTDVAVRYATFAQEHGVELFALGEETDRLFRTRSSARFPESFAPQLTRLVSAVRAVYGGRLTYGQQSFVNLAHPEWWGLDTAASASLFSDLGLDVVGISAAFTLSTEPVTTVWSVPQFEAAWATVFDSFVVPLQARNPTIPIIFSDFACANTVQAPRAPLQQSGEAFVRSDGNGNGEDDGMEQQSNFFTGFLNANASYGHLVRGVVFAWSQIDTAPGMVEYDQTHRGIQIMGKPAEDAIRAAYADWAVAP